METTTYFCSKQKRMKKIIIGFIILTAGLLLLGFNTGILDPAYKHLIFTWPVLLIALGLANFFERSSFWAGVILTSIGTFFFLPRLIEFHFNFIHLFWPLLLIMIGVVIILKRTLFNSFTHRGHIKSGSKLEEGVIDESNVFGSSNRVIQQCNFKGGKISNVFAGSKIDLTRTTLSDQENYLDIACVFGGVEIIVPSNWRVQIQVSSIMGAFSDKRFGASSQQIDNSKTLIIKGSVVFGGGEIKS
ncbi:MAG: hypothetical protein A2X08_17745 [Bacteroidetes bacterium GWA2_32_17]|nr:MAG: hypothetical protein A2X08_17745 [Bacteroidetes bacterium GWA2_32_17]